MTLASKIFGGGPCLAISRLESTSLSLIRSSCYRVHTDVSDSGWDAQLSGLWSRDASTFSINHREFLAVFLAVRGFLHLLRDRTVSLFTDNTTALSYLRKEGGTRSSILNSVAQTVLRLCEANGVRLLPQFVPGRLNVLADALS